MCVCSMVSPYFGSWVSCSIPIAGSMIPSGEFFGSELDLSGAGREELCLRLRSGLGLSRGRVSANHPQRWPQLASLWQSNSQKNPPLVECKGLLSIQMPILFWVTSHCTYPPVTGLWHNAHTQQVRLGGGWGAGGNGCGAIGIRRAGFSHPPQPQFVARGAFRFVLGFI